jgi:hypothetical protein
MLNLIEKLKANKWLFWLGGILLAIWVLKDLIMGAIFSGGKEKLDEAKLKDAHLDEKVKEELKQAKEHEEAAKAAEDKVGKPNVDEDWHKK